MDSGMRAGVAVPDMPVAGDRPSALPADRPGFAPAGARMLRLKGQFFNGRS
jgi:hypothetical protein